MQNKKKTAPQNQEATKDEVMESALTIIAKLTKAEKRLFLYYISIQKFSEFTGIPFSEIEEPKRGLNHEFR